MAIGAASDLYGELGVSKAAGTDEIRRAYRRRAKKARTGKVDEEKPDNERAQTLEMIGQLIDQMIEQIPEHEMGKTDVLELLREQFVTLKQRAEACWMPSQWCWGTRSGLG